LKKVKKKRYISSGPKAPNWKNPKESNPATYTRANGPRLENYWANTKEAKLRGYKLGDSLLMVKGADVRSAKEKGR